MVERLFENEFPYPRASWFSSSDGIDAVDRAKIHPDSKQPGFEAKPEDFGSAEYWARRLSPELVDHGASGETLRTYSQSTPKYRKLEFD